MTMLEEVINEVPKIIKARNILGLSEDKHSTPFYQGLSRVESNGVNIQDEDSCVGTLQISDPYYEDAYNWLAPRYPHVIEGWPKPVRGARLELRTDDEVPYIIAMAYMERYKRWHNYDVYRMAAMHKGGARSAKEVSKYIPQLGVLPAIRYVSNNWKYGPTHRRAGEEIVPRMFLYVTGRDAVTGARNEYRFAQAYRDCLAWWKEQQKHCT